MTPDNSPYNAARANLANALLRVGKWLTSGDGAKAAPIGDRYQSALLDAARNERDEQRLRDRIAAIILLYALWAYDEGLQESGADPNQTGLAQVQIQNTVQQWAAQQAAYANGLAQAMVQNTALQSAQIGSPLSQVFAPGAGPAPVSIPPDAVVTAEIQQASAEAIITRVGQWAETLGGLKLQGMVKGAELGGDDPIVYWRLGPTDEHCHDARGMMGCYELSQDGSHPLSYYVAAGLIPRAPGNEEITCHGYRCQCSLVRVANGKQIH